MDKEVIVAETQQVAKPENQFDLLISQAATLDLEKLEKIIALRDREQAKIAKREYDDAFSRFQRDCPIIEKSKKVDFTSRNGTRVNYQYAPIEEIINQTKKLISDCGFSYNIRAKEAMGHMTAVVTVRHIGGHSEDFEFTVPVDKDGKMSGPQAAAAAQTFAKRYAFCNAFGIITGDEDNEEAMPIPVAKYEETADATIKAQAENLYQAKGKDFAYVNQFCVKTYGKGFHALTTPQMQGLIEVMKKA